MSAEVTVTSVGVFFLYSLDYLRGNSYPVRSGDHRLVLYMVGSTTVGWLLRLVRFAGLQATSYRRFP